MTHKKFNYGKFFTLLLLIVILGLVSYLVWYVRQCNGEKSMFGGNKCCDSSKSKHDCTDHDDHHHHHDHFTSDTD